MDHLFDQRRAREFARRLCLWYRKNRRDLPWRRCRDPYAIWVSEAMLQQTTVAAVIPYYERWMRLFPTVRDVAAAALPAILKAWQGLGYYQRARNFHRAAKMICQDYHGRLPGSWEELRALPGFGPYTAAAVLSIAFDKPYPVIDANVRRVMLRALCCFAPATVAQDAQIKPCLDRMIESFRPSIFNQAMMELGALVCRANGPVCHACPVVSLCGAHARGVEGRIPLIDRKKIEKIGVAVGLIWRGRRLFIQKRPDKGLWAGFWEFPGGKIETGETPRQALDRELKEELDVEVTDASRQMLVRHAYTRFQVELHVFNCQTRMPPAVGLTRKWATIPELHRKYPLPSANAKILSALECSGKQRGSVRRDPCRGKSRKEKA